jgi:hypothetical protein
MMQMQNVFVIARRVSDEAIRFPAQANWIASPTLAMTMEPVRSKIIRL